MYKLLYINVADYTLLVLDLVSVSSAYISSEQRGIRLGAETLLIIRTPITCLNNSFNYINR